MSARLPPSIAVHSHTPTVNGVTLRLSHGVSSGSSASPPAAGTVVPLPLPPPVAQQTTQPSHTQQQSGATTAMQHSHSQPHTAIAHAHALPLSMHTVAHAVTAALPAAPGTVAVQAAPFHSAAAMHMQAINGMQSASAQTHASNGHGHANGQSGVPVTFAQAAVAHPHHFAATLTHAHTHPHSHALAQQHHLAVPVQGAMHASPVKAVLATATAAPATPARAHPVQAYAAHALPSPSVNPTLARRQSSTTGSAEKVVMMATIVDSGPGGGGGTANGSSPAHNLNAPRATSQQRHVSPLPKLVSATLLDESKAHAHLTLPGHAPASHTQGQAIPFQRPVPPSVRIVTATIVSPTTAATAAVVPVKNGVSAAAVMAKSVPALAVMAATPANASSASAVPRQRQRIRKRAGRPSATAAAPSSSRKKLTVPDPLDQVEEGVTRCICGSGEDDGFMICCEGCSAWQHGDCVGLSPDAVPDEYYCDLCDPEGELHVAQREERRRAKEEHAEFGLAADGKRRRRKRSRMSLGKKRRRGSASAAPTSTGHHTRQGSRGAAMHDDDGGGSGDSGSSSQSEGEEDEMDDGDQEEEEGFSGESSSAGRNRRSHGQTAAAQGSRRSGGKHAHGQPAAAHHGATASAGALHLDTSSPSLSASGGSSTLTSPLYSGASVGAASHGSVGAHFMLSPTSTAAAATLAGATVQLPGQSHPNGGSGGGGGNNGSHTVPTSGEVTPAASPTGETKLRSLIFTMEQLANGQMTSPVSTSASLSLSQLARFNYPPGSAIPGPPGVNGSALPSPTGSPGVGGANDGLIAPFPLVRQVSENTANVAMTLQQGFSLPNGAGNGNGGSGGGSLVVLEAFSPVLPASLMGVAGTIPPTPASFASLPPSALSAHSPGPAPAPAGAATAGAAASVDSPALLPSPAQSPSDTMLLSPNTQAAVSTLASAIPIVSAN